MNKDNWVQVEERYRAAATGGYLAMVYVNQFY